MHKNHSLNDKNGKEYISKKRHGNRNGVLKFGIMYLIWAFANFYLLTGEKSRDAGGVFYPFTNIIEAVEDGYGFRSDSVWHDYWDKFFYDFSEFIVYVFVAPAILYGIYKLICKGYKRKES